MLKYCQEKLFFEASGNKTLTAMQFATRTSLQRNVMHNLLEKMKYCVTIYLCLKQDLSHLFA